jgi:hypothetical protein
MKLNMIFWSKSFEWRAVLGLLFALFVSSLCVGQKPSADPSALPQLETRLGPIAIDTPKGWSRATGPGLAIFLREGTNPDTADAWIYISSAPIGPKEEYRNLNSYIQYDVTAFRDKYKNGTVQKEQPMLLPPAKTRARIYTFESTEWRNAYEQVVYIEEAHRVLVLTLSAKTSNAFLQSMAAFREFVQSYRGSANPGAVAKKP